MGEGKKVKIEVRKEGNQWKRWVDSEKDEGERVRRGRGRAL
jgi:hypothetical protein